MFKALNKRKLGKKGFTLIELIVVIAIIAILAVILLPRFTGFTRNANLKAAISDTRNILLAVQALNADGKTIDTATSAAALDEINTYAGTNFVGTLGALGTLNTGTFSFQTVKGTYTITVYVDDYVLRTDSSPTNTPLISG